MRVARKSGRAWHFAEAPHCGWARRFAGEGGFDEEMIVSSLDGVDGFCSTCLERRDR